MNFMQLTFWFALDLKLLGTLLEPNELTRLLQAHNTDKM